MLEVKQNLPGFSAEYSIKKKEGIIQASKEKIFPVFVRSNIQGYILPQQSFGPDISVFDCVWDDKLGLICT